MKQPQQHDAVEGDEEVKPTNKEKKLKVRCLAIAMKRHNKNAACHGQRRIVLPTVVKLPLCLHLCSKCNKSVNVANKSEKNSSCHTGSVLRINLACRMLLLSLSDLLR